jgi:hypothetical protein
MFFLQQNQRTRGQNRFFCEVGSDVGGRDGPTMYTDVSKYKNGNIKKEIKSLF